MVHDDLNTHQFEVIPNIISTFFIVVSISISIVIQQTILAWRYVYLLGSVIFLIFAVVWQIFGSSEVQPWDSYWVGEQNVDYTRIEENCKCDEKTMENGDDVY